MPPVRPHQMKMTFENWHEDFSRFAEDLYPGRYSRDYVQRLAEMGEEVRRLAIEQGDVVCPWHGAHFDLGTGQPTCPPASVEVNTYPVRVRGQDIEIKL